MKETRYIIKEIFTDYTPLYEGWVYRKRKYFGWLLGYKKQQICGSINREHAIEVLSQYICDNEPDGGIFEIEEINGYGRTIT